MQALRLNKNLYEDIVFLSKILFPNNKNLQDDRKHLYKQFVLFISYSLLGRCLSFQSKLDILHLVEFFIHT